MKYHFNAFSSKLLFFVLLAPVGGLKADPIPIEAAKVGIDFILIGTTGVAIGTEVEIEGKLLQRHPFVGTEIEVSKVNGKSLEEPIYIKIDEQSIEKMKTGLQVSLLGIETVKLVRIPLINQTDRKSIGNLGCELGFEVRRIIKK